jgi:hypothetical protein
LARRSGLSLETIKRLERIRGPVDANIRTLNALSAAFEDLEIAFDFDDGVGVRRREGASAAVRHDDRRPPEGVDTTLFRLMFHSTLNVQDQELRRMLEEVNAIARRRNLDLGLTGVLLASRGRLLQVLEGDKTAVLHMFGSIAADPRHRDLRVVERREIRTRHFPDWTLSCGFFEVDTAAFSAEPSLHEVFAPEALTPAACLGVLAIARDLHRGPPRRGRAPALSCPMATDCFDPSCRGKIADGAQAAAAAESRAGHGGSRLSG